MEAESGRLRKVRISDWNSKQVAYKVVQEEAVVYCQYCIVKSESSLFEL